MMKGVPRIRRHHPWLSSAPLFHGSLLLLLSLRTVTTTTTTTAFLVPCSPIHTAATLPKQPIVAIGSISCFASSIETNSEEERFSANVASQSTTYQPLIQSIQDFQPSNTSEAYRVFHGRGGSFSGCEHITLDWFPPVLLLTSYNQELSKQDLAEIMQIVVEKNYSRSISDRAPPYNDPDHSVTLVYQFRSPTNATTTILKGEIPNPHVISENGMKFLVRLDRSKNHGIFLDMANGRTWLQQRASGKHVLNLFAYTCGFSIAALSGGAESVVNVDMVNGVLKTGQQNHELNQLTAGARFLAHDIFKSWGKIRKLGPYDIIVADPPSYQKNSFVAKKDYGKIVRRLPDLLSEGGEVLLCLNAPELETQWLVNIVTEEAPSLLFVERLENPPSFPSVDLERSLKVLRYRLAKAPSDNSPRTTNIADVEREG